MNFNAAALKLMADKGLSLDDIVEIVAASEAPAELRPAQRTSAYGPKERWGYDGPITPQLPDREWWPLRNSILKRDDYTCRYCGDHAERMCADHVIPLSRGGSNDESNLVACCIPCNSSKCDRLLDEWEGRVCA